MSFGIDEGNKIVEWQKGGNGGNTETTEPAKRWLFRFGISAQPHVSTSFWLDVVQSRDRSPDAKPALRGSASAVPLPANPPINPLSFDPNPHLIVT